MDGSKLTHHTSPRFIAHVSDGSLSPFNGFLLSFLVLGHLGIRLFKLFIQDMWAHKIFNKVADAASSYSFVKALVYLFVDSDGQLLLHDAPRIPYVLNTY